MHSHISQIRFAYPLNTVQFITIIIGNGKIYDIAQTKKSRELKKFIVPIAKIGTKGTANK